MLSVDQAELTPDLAKSALHSVNILYSELVRAKAASRVALRHKDRKVTTGIEL
jgi:hypothetical protein